ncbi:MAG: FAD-dependent oxidoreductase [Dorea sp.]|jgi:2,4-dienoyl-CoA reductase-like NADH-dependent reductase (Old Yellow Enzyme family)/thioredoxin reductase|nr:FAD-dependent oxidoreductase [Dorea sp.]
MFESLFKSVKINKMELENRLIVSPMVTCFAKEDGKVTEQYVEYVREKAKGGWGMIINEAHAAIESGKAFDKFFGLYSDDQIEGQKELVAAAHEQGVKIAVQLVHAGRQSLYTGAPLVAPSPIADPTSPITPNELTLEEIKEIIESFGDAALRAKKAGYDAVEIHGAHGYLIQEFTSQYSNKRTDEYGGDLLGRAKFSLDIIHNIRSKVGEDYPLIYRMSTDEYLPNGEGLKLPDSLALATMYEEAGIDALHSSIGNYTTIHYMLPPAAVKHGESQNLSGELKKVVSIPVINVGRYNDPYIANAAIKAGRCDMVTMGRQSLADPLFPKKAKAGKISDIRHCIGCQIGCVENLYKCSPIHCIVNPRVGYEYQFPTKKSGAKKKVVVIGGGVGGMQAAITAAEQGHDVTLYEKENKLGGQWNLAAMPPYKQELATLVTYQKGQLEKNQVIIHLNSELKAEDILALKPDHVVLATGATPIMPTIKGIDSTNVVTSTDILTGRKSVKGNAAVIGGGEVGTETAAFIASTNRKASVFEMTSELCMKTEGSVKLFLFEYLTDKGVDTYTNAKVLELKDDSVIIERDGQTEEISGFTDIVIAVGGKSYNPLEEELKGKVELSVIGDAKSARQGINAVHEGYEVGYNI